MKNLILGVAVLTVGLGFGNAASAQEELSTATDIIEVFDNARTLLDERIELREVDKYSESLANISGSLRKIAQAGPALAAIGIAADVFSGLSGTPSDTELILDAVAGVSAQVTGVENSISWSYIRTGERDDYKDLKTQLSTVFSGVDVLAESWTTIKNPKSDQDEITDAVSHLREKKTKVRDLMDLLYSECTGKTSANRPIFERIDTFTYGDVGALTKWGQDVLLRMATLTVLESYLFNSPDNAPVDEAEIKQRLQTGNLSMQVQRVVDKYKACDAVHAAAITKARSAAAISSQSERLLTEAFRTKDPSSADLVALLSQLYPSREWVVVKYAPVYGFSNHFLPGGTNRYMIKRLKVNGVPEKYNVVVHHFAVDKTIDADPNKPIRHAERFVLPSIGTLAIESCTSAREECFFLGSDLSNKFGEVWSQEHKSWQSRPNEYFPEYVPDDERGSDMDLRLLFKEKRFQSGSYFSHTAPFIFWARTNSLDGIWDYATSDDQRSFGAQGASISVVWSD